MKPPGDQERRKHKRDIINLNLKILHIETKQQVLAVSYDISVSGIRVVTDTRLSLGEKYRIIIGDAKIDACVVYEERRRSSMMNTFAFYHGMQFFTQITPKLRANLISLIQSNVGNNGSHGK